MSPAKTSGPTPKKGSQRHRETGGRRTSHRAALVQRYTAPIPRSKKTSPPWFGYSLGGLSLVGVLLIVLNYLGVLPGGVSGWYLVTGIVFLGAAFVMATFWR